MLLDADGFRPLQPESSYFRGNGATQGPSLPRQRAERKSRNNRVVVQFGCRITDVFPRAELYHYQRPASDGRYLRSRVTEIDVCPARAIYQLLYPIAGEPRSPVRTAWPSGYSSVVTSNRKPR